MDAELKLRIATNSLLLALLRQSSSDPVSRKAFQLGLRAGIQRTGNPRAIRAFTDAVALWESLSRSRPRSEEYGGALAWSRQRLEGLK